MYIVVEYNSPHVFNVDELQTSLFLQVGAKLAISHPLVKRAETSEGRLIVLLTVYMEGS